LPEGTGGGDAPGTGGRVVGVSEVGVGELIGTEVPNVLPDPFSAVLLALRSSGPRFGAAAQAGCVGGDAEAPPEGFGVAVEEEDDVLGGGRLSSVQCEIMNSTAEVERGISAIICVESCCWG